MTNEQAKAIVEAYCNASQKQIEIFEKTFPSQKSSARSDKEAFETAIKALEKQIPKKTTEEENNRGIDISGEYDIDFNLCCPVCGAVVGTYEEGVNEYFENYCSNCGQAIDVSYSGCEGGEDNV